jgi:hypothetical protein
MGCGKTRLVQGVNIENDDNLIEENRLPVLDTVQDEEKEEGKELEVVDKENQIETMRFNVVTKVNANLFEEIGKVGEDYEAGVVSPGKVKEESLDVKIKKLPVHKKLPPILHPPLPVPSVGVPSSLAKFTKHKPDMDLVRSILGNYKNKNLNDLDLDSVEAHGDDNSIQRIMQELSIDYK